MPKKGETFRLKDYGDTSMLFVALIDFELVCESGKSIIRLHKMSGKKRLQAYGNNDINFDTVVLDMIDRGVMRHNDYIDIESYSFGPLIFKQLQKLEELHDGSQ